jgi:competence protein ComEA
MRRIFSRLQLLKLLGILLLLVTFGLGSWWLKLHEPHAELVFTNKAPVEGTLLREVVYISGEVLKPGMYQVGKTTRLMDVIKMAGGFTAEADLQYVNTTANLAKIVADEEHIFIPSKSIGATATSSSNRININSATIAQLDTLPGIGEATAQAIVRGRPYKNVDDLLKVSGIGEAKLAKIKDLITL